MSDLGRPDWSGRLDALRDDCARMQLDGFVVSAPVNLRYLTGFNGSAGLLLCSRVDHWLITDGRYDQAVRDALAAGQLGPVRAELVERRYDLTLAALVNRLGLHKVGLEAGHATLAVLAAWQQASSDAVEWRPVDGAVERQRVIKDAFEISVLRRGARALSGVARQLGAWVAAGRTERAVARDVDAALERAGFSQPAFPTIVAAGPNSAYPHARPTDRRLETGDLVVLDFGGVLDGYCVDLTRMAAVGRRVEPRARELVDAVREAQDAAMAAVRSGIPGSGVDAAARGVLQARGFGPAFLHGTGHGLGLEVHEAPRLGRADSGSPDVLRAGMVCTIEPGAYLSGFGGARLEDDVLVTADGCEVLTDAPRDLLVV
jgi:Xaa-Pro aminopeptidase